MATTLHIKHCIVKHSLQVYLVSQAAAAEVVLDEVNQVLVVEVVSVAGDELVAQVELLLQEGCDLLGVDGAAAGQAQGRGDDAQQEEHQHEEGEDPQQASVLPQRPDTPGQADHKDDKPDDEDQEPDVDDDVEDCVELEDLPAVPLVHGGVHADTHEEEAAQPQHEVEEEHGVLDPARDVGEVAWDPPKPPQSRLVNKGVYLFILSLIEDLKETPDRLPPHLVFRSEGGCSMHRGDRPASPGLSSERHSFA